ncbi:hypothetical protein [Lactococcus phage CHPC971]|uniref:Uncharacterized protein n=1 Tax=Lactococcus phage CHPC971 TaxID=2575255 RepID=A0A4Y5N1P4_9CAUD|nr:hypothetical protein KMD16_gp31 [Lactococcus phage CHPC971]QCW07633.1 hypothetical protein [Lactococcus phage CHPC971]
MVYIIEEEALKELKEEMMRNPNLFTGGLIVAQTELALDAQSQHFADKEKALLEENIDNKHKWKYRYDLIDWLEAIPEELIARYNIIKNGNFINIEIERNKNSLKHANFPYMSKGHHYQYAGDQYECTSFEHKLYIDNTSTVTILLTKEEKKNEEN